MRSGEFKKITMYDESIETTTSDNSTPYESQLKAKMPKDKTIGSYYTKCQICGGYVHASKKNCECGLNNKY